MITVRTNSPGQDKNGSKILTFKDAVSNLDLHVITYVLVVGNDRGNSSNSIPAATVADKLDISKFKSITAKNEVVMW